MSKKLLSISADIVLLLNRNHALATAGFKVSSPRAVEDAPRLFASDDFAAVLVGNSIPGPVRRSVIAAMREKDPNVPILFVTVIPGEHEPAADRSVDVSRDFGALLRAILECTGDGTDGHSSP